MACVLVYQLWPASSLQTLEHSTKLVRGQVGASRFEQTGLQLLLNAKAGDSLSYISNSCCTTIHINRIHFSLSLENMTVKFRQLKMVRYFCSIFLIATYISTHGPLLSDEQTHEHQHILSCDCGWWLKSGGILRSVRPHLCGADYNKHNSDLQDETNQLNNSGMDWEGFFISTELFWTYWLEGV